MRDIRVWMSRQPTHDSEMALLLDISVADWKRIMIGHADLSYDQCLRMIAYYGADALDLVNMIRRERKACVEATLLDPPHEEWR
jgi:UDP-N-acetylenolpyruvoylglucosamine reductase